jgi:hypothetical protein
MSGQSGNLVARDLLGVRFLPRWNRTPVLLTITSPQSPVNDYPFGLPIGSSLIARIFEAVPDVRAGTKMTH